MISAGIVLTLGEMCSAIFTDKAVDHLLPSVEQRLAFKSALQKTLIDLEATSDSSKGSGTVDRSFTAAVRDELRRKLLDPSVNEGVDYALLERELESIYTDFTVSEEERRIIRQFVSVLVGRLKQESTLQPLLANKIILQQLDRTLTPAEQEKLVVAYLEREAEGVGDIKGIEALLKEDLGDNRYVEPLIEKRERERPEREYLSRRERDAIEPEPERECFVQVDRAEYFTNGPDGKMAVIADSGYGKTTLLRKMFLQMKEDYLTNGYRPESSVPFFFAPTDAINWCEHDIPEILAARLRISGFSDEQVMYFVNDLFYRSKFVFLIDALDQVGDRDKLLGCLTSAAFRGNRVVVTTRPDIWQEDDQQRSGYIHLRLREFDESRWEEYVGTEKLQELKQLVDEEFFSVPILLKLVKQHVLGKTTQPVKNRADLYRRMFDDLVNRPEDYHALSPDSRQYPQPEDIRDDLRQLAHDTLIVNHLGQFPRSEAKRVLGGENALKRLESWQGILMVIERGKQMLFRHRSFQEYLAAEYLYERVGKTETDLEKLKPYLYNPNWEKSLQFLTGLLALEPDQGRRAERLVELILNAPEDLPLVIYRDHLRIVADCLRLAGPTSGRIRRALIDQCQRDRNTPLLRKFGTSVLLQLQCQEAAAIFIGELGDAKADVRGRAASALGELKVTSAVVVTGLLAALRDEASSVRAMAATALVRLKIAPTEVVNELLSELRREDPHIRGAAVATLVEIASAEVVARLLVALRDDDPSVRRLAATVLGESKVASAEVVAGLLVALRDDDPFVRQLTATALGEPKIASAEVVAGLLAAAVRDEASSVRWCAAAALGRLQPASTDVVSGLLTALRYEDSHFRGRVATALGKLQIAPAAVVTRLLEALRDEDYHVQRNAAFALGELKIASAEVVTGLLAALRDKESDVQWRAAAALGKLQISSATVVKGLLTALRDENSHVRGRAADALGKLQIASPEVVTGLLSVLRDESTDVQGRAAIALGELQIASAKIVTGLLVALSHQEDSFVRGRAATALGKLQRASTKVVTGLLAALRDEASSVRRRAADALGRLQIASPEVVTGLLAALRDEDPTVRERAADVLGKLKIRSLEVVTGLLAALRDKHSNVRRRATSALAELKTPEALSAVIADWRRNPTAMGRTLLDTIRSCDRGLRAGQPIKNPIG